jgi:hypothetical protein
MTFWIKKISWVKTLEVGLVYTIFAFIIRQGEALLTLNYYMDPQYFGVWSKLMMPSAGPPPFSFMITSLVMTFVSGVSLAIIYYYLRDHLPKNKTQRALYFSDLMIATSFIFFTLPTYLMFNVPVGLLLSWFISSFIILVIDAFLLVKIIN